MAVIRFLAVQQTMREKVGESNPVYFVGPKIERWANSAGGMRTVTLRIR